MDKEELAYSSHQNLRGIAIRPGEACQNGLNANEFVALATERARPTNSIRLICFATAPYGNVEPRRVVTRSTTGLCARTLKLLLRSEG